MFFFFIGGLQPKIKKVLQSNYGACLNCPSGIMDHVEMAQTFYAFFIPVWTFADKDDSLHCGTCGYTTTIEHYKSLQQQHSSLSKSRLPSSSSTSTSCHKCGSPVNGGWQFCPQCGTHVK